MEFEDDWPALGPVLNRLFGDFLGFTQPIMDHLDGQPPRQQLCARTNRHYMTPVIIVSELRGFDSHPGGGRRLLQFRELWLKRPRARDQGAHFLRARGGGLRRQRRCSGNSVGENVRVGFAGFQKRDQYRQRSREIGSPKRRVKQDAFGGHLLRRSRATHAQHCCDDDRKCQSPHWRPPALSLPMMTSIG